MINFRSTPIKLNEAVFSIESGVSNKIQILRTGKFFHGGQEIEINKSHLKKMVKNFHEGVRGIDIMLDFAHQSDKEAAAWFQDLYLSENGNELWAEVDWTEDGAESVKKKRYRYISADFNFAYKDNETLKECGPTLLGAGLTNRPVVKKMNPTILSENKNNSGEEKMEKEEMQKKLDEMLMENKKLKEDIANLKKKGGEKELSEREENISNREKAVKLAEEKIENDKKLAEKNKDFDKKLSEGKVVEAQREAFIEGDMEKFLEKSVDPKDLNFSEKGHGNGPTKKKEDDEKFESAQDEVISLAEKKAKEDKIEIAEAIEIVLSENKNLYEKYIEETN